ncbi:MAG: TlpA family protein disulfide reductase [Bacteroidia bacterium]|nr:TlpA family protein disulfide reductase [Bacteroidia bacterium]
MTKHSLLLCLVSLMLLPLGLIAETARVSGQIENAKGGEAVVYYSSSLIGRDREVFSGEVGEDGSFEMEVELNEARIMTFAYNREVTSIYLKPSDELMVRLDANEFDETIKYEGKGESVAASNYMAAYFLKFEDTGVQEDMRDAFGNQPIEKAKSFFISLMQSQHKFLQAFAEENELSDNFAQLMQDKSTYYAYTNLLNLPAYRAYKEGMDISEVELPEDYYNFTKKIKVNNPDALVLNEYIGFVRSYLEFAYSQEPKLDSYQEANRKGELTKEIFKGEVLQYMQASMIMEQFQYGSFMAAEKMLKDYKKSAAEEEEVPFLDKLTAVYESIKPISPGSNAPEIELKDENGKEVSLEDFKGKVIYLDFWASWCGPCRREMPYARKLQQDFKGKDVVFLYVSVDDSEEAWRKAMEEEKLDGIHLWAGGFRKSVPESYLVKSIPNYFLIDKNGVIVNNNPPRPSGPTLSEEIKAYLEE